MHRSSWIVLIPVLALTAGCSQPPTDKLTAAEKAVNDARAAGAPKYAPEDFAKLESAFANAKQQVAEQDAKLALLRDYEKAEQSLTVIQSDATHVVSETGRKKDEAKAAALESQQAAQDAVKRAQDRVAHAPVGKDRAAVEAIKADVETLMSSLPEIERAIAAEDYQAAQAKAKAVVDKSDAVTSEIDTALAKLHRAQPKKKL